MFVIQTLALVILAGVVVYDRVDHIFLGQSMLGKFSLQHQKQPPPSKGGMRSHTRHLGQDCFYFSMIVHQQSEWIAARPCSAGTSHGTQQRRYEPASHKAREETAYQHRCTIAVPVALPHKDSL